jgi:hypothetical protein
LPKISPSFLSGYRTGVFWFGLLWSFKITLLSGAVLDTFSTTTCFGFNTNVNFSRILSFKFQVSKSNFYLDSSLQSKVEEANASDLSWTKRFGAIAPFTTRS